MVWCARHWIPSGRRKLTWKLVRKPCFPAFLKNPHKTTRRAIIGHRILKSMAAAVAALTKNGLLTLTLTLRHQNRLHYLWKTCNKHSISNQVPSPKNAANRFPHRLQSERRSQFPHSIPRNNGSLDFSARGVVSSSLSSIVTSSSPKLGICAWYLGIIKSRPIVTKSITAALIYTVADFSSQVT